MGLSLVKSTLPFAGRKTTGYEGMSNQEAAEAMDVTLGSFQQLLFRAKQNLRDTLADFLPENEDEAQNG